MIYITIYTLLILSALLCAGDPCLKRIAFWSWLSFFCFFIGYRQEVGCDWSGYQQIFENAGFFTIEDVVAGTEPGFSLLNLAVHWFGLEYHYVNVLSALIFLLGFYLFCGNRSDRLPILVLSFPVLVINLVMSGIRQAIALSFIMVAYNAYVTRRRFWFALLVFGASLFHKSALVFLFLVPLIGRKISPRSFAFAGILAVPGLLYLFEGVFDVYVERYIRSDLVAHGAAFRAAPLAATGLFFWLFAKKAWRERFFWDYELMKLASLAMMALLPLTLFSSVVGDRFGYYLMPLQLTILARVPTIVAGWREAHLFSAAPYVFFYVFLVGWTELSDLFQLCYLPYKNYLW